MTTNCRDGKRGAAAGQWEREKAAAAAAARVHGKTCRTEEVAGRVAFHPLNQVRLLQQYQSPGDGSE